MRAVDIIQRKRDGKLLSGAEIRYLIQGYSQGEIPDYQMSAWAMAVFFQGMNVEETSELTMAMARSGEQLDLSSITGVKVDKHSTGGVGDTTTLVLAALVAAAGVPVAKMSGRGLGHTGGTIDKLESIAGFKVEQSKQQFIDQVNRCGVAIMSQSANITPADKQLYSLRDVTATVDSIPLIASSIMSKKIASGTDAIVLDVKTGQGAFMKSLDQSIELATAMVNIGEQVGRETIAIISQMDQPLGYAVGNALEVMEAIDTLHGRGPEDLTELCLVLGSYMLIAARKASSYGEARAQLIHHIESGSAFDKFKQWIAAQGGNIEMIDRPELLPSATQRISISANMQGFVFSIEAEQIGVAAMLLGAGRSTKDAAIDLGVGIKLCKKVGDPVQLGETIAVLYANDLDESQLSAIKQQVLDAFTLDSHPLAPHSLIYAVVSKDGMRQWQE